MVDSSSYAPRLPAASQFATDPVDCCNVFVPVDEIVAIVCELVVSENCPKVSMITLKYDEAQS